MKKKVLVIPLIFFIALVPAIVLADNVRVTPEGGTETAWQLPQVLQQALKYMQLQARQ